MKSASTPEYTEKILYQLSSSQSNVLSKVEWYDDTTSTWYDMTDDIDNDAGIIIDKAALEYRYAHFKVTPPSATCSFSVLSKNGEYSPESTILGKNSILKKNRKVRISFGVKINIDEIDEYTPQIPLRQWHTTQAGYATNLNIAGEVSPPIDFQDAFLFYGGGNYNSLNYSPQGYALYEIDTSLYDVLSEFVLTMNTTGAKIYYKVGNTAADFTDTDLSTYTYIGNSLNGGLYISNIYSGSYRYIRIAIIFDDALWASQSITSFQLHTELLDTTHIEWFISGTFFLNDPVFDEPPAPEIPRVQCDGRNAWKKFMERDYNLPNVSSMTIGNLIKFICDVVGIGYTTDSIASTLDTDFPARTLSSGLGDNPKIESLLSSIAEIIFGISGYQMWIDDDGIFWCQKRPTDYAADYMFTFYDYVKSAKQFNTDKQLTRIIFETTSDSPNAETILGSATGQTATGDITVFCGGTALHKRIVFSTTGDYTITKVQCYNTYIVMTITGTTGTYNYTLYGCIIPSPPTASGEAIDIANMMAIDGQDFIITNPLLNNDAEAKTTADNFVAAYGDPQFKASIDFPFLHPLLELNDQCLIWGRFVFNDTLYFITEIKHYFKLGDAISSFTLEDSGRKFTDLYSYDWDIANLDWDLGLLWDMQYGNQAVPNPDTDNFIYDIAFS